MEVNGEDTQVQDTGPAQATCSEVPKVVRFYGSIIMGFYAIGMVTAVVLALLNLARGDGNALFEEALYFAIALVFYRLGKALRGGEKSAVYGICILSVLVSAFSSYLLISGSVKEGLLFLCIVAVFYVPPTISAFRHWDAFK
ncbi:MAG: hypothetical protein JW860_14105 [Sedimentisphaerales bacterium]|nr:hypothetical protein [Sedimentisphaerales bacterium]